MTALRDRIFPTLYAAFQRSRGLPDRDLKIRNRSLRSLTRCCLYLRDAEGLERTLKDAELLFEKYCRRARDGENTADESESDPTAP